MSSRPGPPTIPEQMSVPPLPERIARIDDELSKLAHDAMRHTDAMKRNALTGGIIGAVGDLAIAATGGGNTGGELARQGAAAGAMAQMDSAANAAANWTFMFLPLLARIFKSLPRCNMRRIAGGLSRV